MYMINNDYLPSLTTSNLLTTLVSSVPSSLFSKGFDTLNGTQLASIFSDSTAKGTKISETEHKLKFKVPGYEKNEINITIENSEKNRQNFKYWEQLQFLKVSVTAENKEEGILKQEAYFPRTIDETTIEAKLNNGILVITAKIDPKKNKERQIQIS